MVVSVVKLWAGGDYRNALAAKADRRRAKACATPGSILLTESIERRMARNLYNVLHFEYIFYHTFEIKIPKEYVSPVSHCLIRHSAHFAHLPNRFIVRVVWFIYIFI